MFGCSCCPPNLVRLIPSIADFIYTYNKDTLFVHQYIANEGTADGAKVAIKTLYEESDTIEQLTLGGIMIVIVDVSLCRSEMEHFSIFQAFSWFFF